MQSIRFVFPTKRFWPLHHIGQPACRLAVMGLALGAVAGNMIQADEITVLVGAAAGRPPSSPTTEIVNEPFAVDFDTQGRLYGVEFTRGNRVFRSRSPITDGLRSVAVEFVAGPFQRTDGKTPLHLPPTASADVAKFNGMHDVAVGRNGTIYLADTFNHVIRTLDPSTQQVSIFAGTGKPGSRGDGGPAALAEFNQPYCGSLSPDGRRLLIADIRNHRLRAIDIDSAIVTSVAGNGMSGKPVDDAVATETPLAGPRAACEARDGTIYLVLREGNAVVAIRDERAKTVVNHSGKAGYGGDGGHARDALLAGPKYVCMDRQERGLIVDTENHCIRRYDPQSGTIDLIAGVPKKAGTLIGVDWRQTELRRPHGVRIAPDGRLVIADSDNDRLLIGPYGP